MTVPENILLQKKALVMYMAHNRKASNALCTLCRGENCQQNVTDLAGVVWLRVAGLRAGYRTRPTTEHGTPVSRYEQLMAADRPQMLTTSIVHRHRKDFKSGGAQWW